MFSLPPAFQSSKATFKDGKGRKKDASFFNVARSEREEEEEYRLRTREKEASGRERGGGLAKNSGLGRRNCKVSFFSRGCFFPPPPGSSSLADDLSEELSASFFSTSFRREREYGKRQKKVAPRPSTRRELLSPLSFELKHSCCPRPPPGVSLSICRYVPPLLRSLSRPLLRSVDKKVFSFAFFAGLKEMSRKLTPAAVPPV